MKNLTEYRKMPVGYGMVQTAVMKLDNLSIQGKAVYSLLCSYTGANEFCFPSMETIAKDLNFKTRRSVQKYLAELEEIGLIKRGKLYPKDPLKTHNTYSVMYIENDKNQQTSMDTTVSIDGYPGTPSTDTVIPPGRIPQYPYNNNIINNNIINNKEKNSKNFEFSENPERDTVNSKVRSTGHHYTNDKVRRQALTYNINNNKKTKYFENSEKESQERETVNFKLKHFTPETQREILRCLSGFDVSDKIKKITNDIFNNDLKEATL